MVLKICTDVTEIMTDEKKKATALISKAKELFVRVELESDNAGG